MTVPTNKIFKHFLICMNLYHYGKDQLIPSIHYWDTVNFKVQRQWHVVNFRNQRTDCLHSFFTMPSQKIINKFSNFVNRYQHAKIETLSSLCSGEIFVLKIQQSDWLRAFWPIPSGARFFPNTGFVQEHSK